MAAMTLGNLPLPVARVLRKLGNDIKNARKRRRISTRVMAERASISRTTLNKVEKGDPGVSIGIYVTVLFILGFIDRIADLADLKNDIIGMDLEDEFLPKRIRST
jgi:transcriptional regulator with XRE-family HTH domain